MKKLMFIFTLLLFLMGCDNNEGPFDIRMENGKRILYSNDKPAKGWVQTTWNNMNGTTTVVSEIYYDKGRPAGDFKLYNNMGELLILGEGKWKNDTFEGEVQELKEFDAIAKGTFTEDLAMNLIVFNGYYYYKNGFAYNFLKTGSYRSSKGYDGISPVEFFLKNGKFDGEGRINWPNGNPKSVEIYKDGIVQNQKNYSEDGVLHTEKFYKDGKCIKTKVY